MTLLSAMLLTACATPAAEPAADPERGGEEAASALPPYTAADVAFMQGMIPHHRQALEMTALVPERSRSDAIHLLAERIEVSQTDEIAMMSRWLESRGEAVPEPAGHPGHGAAHGARMPGMLTEAEMSRLAGARGIEFDRLFLELMIRHHEGALTMVEQLLASPGAAQDVDAYRIASEIDSDQRIEIQRMQRMLSALS